MCCGNWLWKNYQDFISLNKQAVIPRPNVNRKLFYLWRIFACLLAFGNVIHVIETCPLWIDLFFMTDWGVFATGLAFLFLLIDTVLNARKTDEQITLEGQEYNKNSPWWAYKWSITMYQTALVMEVMITFLFWCFLMPIFYLYTKETSVCGIINAVGQSNICAQWVFDHGVLLAMLVVDWAINMIRFDTRHYAVTVIACCIYIPFNFIGYCFLKSPIYPGMDWFNTPKIALYVSLGGFVIMTIGFVFVKWCTDKKFKRIDKHKEEDFLEVAQDEEAEVEGGDQEDAANINNSELQYEQALLENQMQENEQTQEQKQEEAEAIEQVDQTIENQEVQQEQEQQQTVAENDGPQGQY